VAKVESRSVGLGVSFLYKGWSGWLPRIEIPFTI